MGFAVSAKPIITEFLIRNLYGGCLPPVTSIYCLMLDRSLKAVTSYCIAGAIYVVFLTYCVVSICLCYVCSFYFDSMVKAYYTMSTVFFLGGKWEYSPADTFFLRVPSQVTAET